MEVFAQQAVNFAQQNLKPEHMELVQKVGQFCCSTHQIPMIGEIPMFAVLLLLIPQIKRYCLPALSSACCPCRMVGSGSKKLRQEEIDVIREFKKDIFHHDYKYQIEVSEDAEDEFRKLNALIQSLNVRGRAQLADKLKKNKLFCFYGKVKSWRNVPFMSYGKEARNFIETIEAAPEWDVMRPYDQWMPANSADAGYK